MWTPKLPALAAAVLSVLLGAGFAPPLSAEAEVRAPWIRVTPTSYRVDGGATVTSAQPLAEALRHAEPGSTVELEAGTYPVLRLGFGRGPNNADCSGTEVRPITIQAAHPGPNKPVISAVGKSDALLIDQKAPVQHITFKGLVFEPGYRSAVIFYRQKGAAVHRGFRFLDCDILGGWDHLKAEGAPSKWGVNGHRIADFEWRGVLRPSVIRDLKNEHAFYLQNIAGDVLIENVHATRLGRTFVQFTSRSADGPQATGDVVVRRNVVRDVCIGAGDAYKGGSAFTVTGNMPKATFLFEDNSYRAGFDPALRKLTRKNVPYGTGAFVVWGEKDPVRVGSITLKDNDFRFADGTGDRPVVALGAAKRVALEGQNTFVAGAFGVALAVDPPRGSGVPTELPVLKITMDPRTECDGRVEWRGKPAPPAKRVEWGLPRE